MNRRYLFVQLPYFPMERFLKARKRESQQTKPWWDEQANKAAIPPSTTQEVAKGPIVLVQHGAKGTRISAVGPDALSEGLWPDMKLADARALIPQVRVEQHDVEADRKTFTALAHWMLRYSPAVALHGSDGFLLDITGCGHLFGGEDGMAQDISERLEKFGFTSRLAVTDSVGASIALVSHGAQELHILPPGHSEDMLDALPVEALRLDDDCVILLKRLGLKRIGDVRVLPRAALERRFRERKGKIKDKTFLARSVQWRLDQLSGQMAEPLDTIKEPQPFRALLQCPDMALEQQAVEIALDQLLIALCQQLNKAGYGGRCFCLTGYRADGGLSSVTVYLSQPTQSPPMIKRLFKDKLDQIDCGYGIDLFVLSADNFEKFSSSQQDLVDTDQADHSSASILEFADTLANRTGRQSASRLSPRTSHVPERAQQLATVATGIDWQNWQTLQPVWSPRPLRLFARPEAAEVTAELPDSPPMQFVWRRVLRRVVRSRGPERILPEWWHDDLKTKRSASFRDYYDVEDSRGLRYWIFRSIKHVPIEPIEDAAPLIANDNKSKDEEEPQREPEFTTTISWFVHGLF